MRNTFAVLGALGALIFPIARGTAVLAQSASLPIGWSAADVGGVGQPGHTSQSGSTWSVAGSGADIWGTADAFHFAYTPINGDTEIYALVRSQQPTHPFAKAGLMIRASLHPASDHVLIDVKPGGGVEVLTRWGGVGPTTRFVAGATTSGPVWLKLTERGSEVSVFISTTAMCPTLNGSCTSWTQVAARMPFYVGRSLLGLAVTSHDTSAVNSAVFDFLHVTELTRPWSQQNSLPSAQLGENAWTSDGVFHVPGVGSDIWGRSDEFRFVSQTGHGDAEIVARAVRQDNTSPFAKAGIMMRAKPGPTAAHVILDVKPDGGIEFMTRSSDGGDTNFLAGGFMPLPVWLRLTRRGDQVDGYASNDGSGWMLIGTTTLPPAAPPVEYSVGLAVTSHHTSVVNNAVFDNVSLSGLNPQFYGPNLLQRSGFEEYPGPALGAPWVSDRAAPWMVETAHPHGGAKNATCRSTSSQDCGIYQEYLLPPTAPTRGAYILALNANVDKPGAIIGIDVNGTSFPAGPVDVRRPGTYCLFQWGLILSGGDRLRIWMYSPANGSTAVLDDVTLSPYSGPR